MSFAETAIQPDFLAGLNPTQRQAAEAIEGPVLVVAGPGSGKTRVLTFRIANMIEHGVKPWEILALTFTNKAAREMKARLEKVVGQRGGSVWAGTFHSIFARLLRLEAERLGYQKSFTIYDTSDSGNVVKAITKEMSLDPQAYPPNGVRSRISLLKNSLITPRAYLEREDLMTEDRVANRPHFHTIYTRYVARCKQSGAMDFDDLLFRMFELLQNHEDVRERFQQRFRYVLVDEFQDTNTLQYAIVKKLVQYEGSPRNICVVGDDAQSIYAFRGATIQNILDFERDFAKYGIRTFKLEQNYRSTEHIVAAANEVINHNKRQIQKQIRSEKGVGERIKVIRALSDTEEGKRVVDSIQELKNRFHVANSDIAILYRTNAQSRIFEEYLRRSNLAYRVFGGVSFYQRKEVKDAIAYLRLAVNPRDGEALNRVINYPRRGLGNTTLTRLDDYARAHELTAYDVIQGGLAEAGLTGKAGATLRDFGHLLGMFAQKAADEDAYEAAMYILQQSGLYGALQGDTSIEGVSKLENVEALLDGIKEFVDDDELVVGLVLPGQEEEPAPAPTDKSLSSYLQNIALVTDADADDGGNPEYVSLMSVHAAKGLEYKAVFVVGMEEQLFPAFRALDSPDDLDEERRLFYVAITRAEAYLYLCYANSRYRHGNVRYNEPSRFLEEISDGHLEDSSGQLRRRRLDPTAPSAANLVPRARVSGAFAKRNEQARGLAVDPNDFRPSPQERIVPGAKVLHMKFGHGKVISVDGAQNNRVATVHFDGIDEPQRKLALKYAKLQVMGQLDL